MRRLSVVFRAAVVALAVMIACQSGTARSQPPSVGLPAGHAPPTAAQLDEVAKLIADHYVRAIAPESLHTAALACLNDRLDPYSHYLSRNARAELDKKVNGTFGGIGVAVNYDSTTRVVTVQSPYRGSPSLAAGVRPGDVIVAVDELPAAGHSFDDVTAAMRGPVGSRVRVTVRHEGSTHDTTLTMRRAVVHVPSVAGFRTSGDDAHRFWADERARIAYLYVDHLADTTPREMTDMLAAIRALGARGLVLDLRDDLGGSMSGAIATADLFLDAGTIVTVSMRGKRDEVDHAHHGTACDLPLVVLVNEGSASAAELLAASLQDNGRARVAGSRSYGKGVGQMLYSLKSDPGTLKLTVLTYWRPSRKPIERHMTGFDQAEGGVWPDSGLAVAITDEEYGKVFNVNIPRTMRLLAAYALPDTTAMPEDHVLAKAIDVLKGAVAR